MKEVNRWQFCKEIAEDHNIELNQKHKVYSSEFKEKNKSGKRKINFHSDGFIVDKQGNEFPYMMSQHSPIRNDEKLIDFDYLYVIRPKGLAQILEETKAKVSSKPCRICEGGGWTSAGTRYTYKDIYCEI